MRALRDARLTRAARTPTLQFYEAAAMPTGGCTCRHRGAQAAVSQVGFWRVGFTEDYTPQSNKESNENESLIGKTFRRTRRT
jgi:hypothetical protein